MLCALMYRQNGDLANLLKSARKTSAPECPFECGGGGNRYRGDIYCIGASLRLLVVVVDEAGVGGFGS